MFKRYDLTVYVDQCNVYNASFSSINNLVKFSCGFDRSYCTLMAIDTLFEKSIPIDELIEVFKGDSYGV